MRRCAWAKGDPLLIEYHDRAWGVPVHEDMKLFEFLVLEGMQAGLSWTTILKKRENLRRAFSSFRPDKVARYSAADVRRLLTDRGIIKNRLKVTAAIENAQRFLEVQQEFGSFDSYIWRFVGGRPIKHRFRALSSIPARTRESEDMSRNLHVRGFRFVGPTICYAFMQAVGMVNDHLIYCFRYDQL